MNSPRSRMSSAVIKPSTNRLEAFSLHEAGTWLVETLESSKLQYRFVLNHNNEKKDKVNLKKLTKIGHKIVPGESLDIEAVYDALDDINEKNLKNKDW